MLRTIIITSLIILIPLGAVAKEAEQAKPARSSQQLFVRPEEPQQSFTDRIKQWFRDDMVVKPPDDKEMSPIEPKFEDPAGSGPSVTAFGWEPIIQMVDDWNQFGYFYRKRMDTLAPANLPASQITPTRPTGEFGYQFEFVVFCTDDCTYFDHGPTEIFIRTYLVVELTSGTNTGHFRYFPIDVIKGTLSSEAKPLHYPAGTTPDIYANSHVVMKVIDLDRVNCFAEPFENDNYDVPNIVALKQAWKPCGSYAWQARGDTDIPTGHLIGAWADYRGNITPYGTTPSINYNQFFITPYGISEQGNAENKTVLPYDITLKVYTNTDKDMIVEDEGGKLKEFILNQTDLADYLLYTNIFPVAPKPTGKTQLPYIHRKVVPESADYIWTFDHRMGWPAKLAPALLDNPTWN